jgi:2-phosphosulfolactate phosphatase
LADFFDQAPFEICCEWGLEGAERLAHGCAAAVIVDVLSFSTAVDVAVGRGASVFPYRRRDQSAEEYASSLDALLAGPVRGAGFSLSPASLQAIPAGARLVLPSPNGSTLSLATGQTPTFAGCLRNARAVAEAAQALGRRILVAPAGERWPGSQTLRPAFEDLVGAGAIIHYLRGTRSPEATLAEAAFWRCRDELADYLKRCSSGRELVERGFAADVELAAALNVSRVAPLLVGGAYTAQAG